MNLLDWIIGIAGATLVVLGLIESHAWPLILAAVVLVLWHYTD